MALAAHRILLGGPIGDAADEDEQHAELHLDSLNQKKENEVEAVEGGTETAHQDVSAQKRAFLDRVIVFPVFLELLNHLCRRVRSLIAYHPSKTDHCPYRPPIAPTSPQRS